MANMAAVLDAAVAAVDLAAEPTTIDLSDAVVEGIARNIRSDGFAVVDGALGDAHAAALRSSCLAVDKTASTIAEGTKMTVDGKRRDDVIAWLKKSDDAAVAAHRLAMDALRAKLEAALALKMDSSSFMTAQYAAGSAGYVRHRDSAPRRPSGRKLTAIYYLNPAWTDSDGGELRIWPDSCAEAYVGGARDDAGPHRDLAPRHDRLLVFRSALEHAVLPSRADRLALTTWFFNKLELGLELIAEKRALRQAREVEYECERGCGFRGGFDAVAAHEATCVAAAQ